MLAGICMCLCAAVCVGWAALQGTGEEIGDWLARLPFGSATTPPNSGASPSRVLVTRTEVIGPEGGVIEADGWQITFPAGAVPSQTTVDVRQLDARGLLDSRRAGLLLEVTAPVQRFQKRIEFKIPLPSEYTPAHAGAAMALLLEPETGEWLYEPAEIQVRAGQPELVLETDHLSMRFFEWLASLLEYKFPPEQADLIELPYYSQGVTPECWAAALQMGAESARHSSQGEIFNLIGALGPVSGGPSTPRIRWSPAIESSLELRTGTVPERIFWMAFQQQIQVEYIQRQLAFERRPVLLFSYTKSHAMMLLGYPDRQSFYVHDPKQGPGNLYKRMTLAELGLDVTGNTTIVIPVAPAENRPLVSVNLLDDFLEFTAPGGTWYSFRWDAGNPQGYSMRANRPVPNGKIVETIPEDVTEVNSDRISYTGIEVANAYLQGGPKRVNLRIEITGHGPGNTRYVQSVSVVLASRTVQRVGFSPIPVDEFRDPAPVPVRYTFKVTATVDGRDVDEAGFDFVLEPKVPPTLARPPKLGPGKCTCPDGKPLALDPSLGCAGLLMPPMDPDWKWCYRDCVEACGCDPDDPDLTCACKCLLGK